MNVEKIKLELFNLILSINNPELLNNLLILLKKEEIDFWDEISDNEKEEIFQGIKEIDEGMKHSYNSIVDKYRIK